jgi:thiol:disulfide interchange protein
MTASIHATILRVALAAALVAAPCFAQPALAQEGENADQIMAQLKSRAAAEQKNILLSFSASWCVNCRLFDGFLADRAIHPILDRVFVIGDMTAGEHAGDNRLTNTLGA